MCMNVYTLLRRISALTRTVLLSPTDLFLFSVTRYTKTLDAQNANVLKPHNQTHQKDGQLNICIRQTIYNYNNSSTCCSHTIHTFYKSCWPICNEQFEFAHSLNSLHLQQHWPLGSRWPQQCVHRLINRNLYSNIPSQMSRTTTARGASEKQKRKEIVCIIRASRTAVDSQLVARSCFPDVFITQHEEIRGSITCGFCLCVWCLVFGSSNFRRWWCQAIWTSVPQSHTDYYIVIDDSRE